MLTSSSKLTIIWSVTPFTIICGDHSFKIVQHELLFGFGFLFVCFCFLVFFCLFVCLFVFKVEFYCLVVTTIIVISLPEVSSLHHQTLNDWKVKVTQFSIKCHTANPSQHWNSCKLEADQHYALLLIALYISIPYW